MGRLIDESLLQEKLALIPMEERTFRRTVEELENAPTVEAIPIPKDATNEDILKAVFPNDADDIIKYIKTAILNGWLNSKYEGVRKWGK